MTYPDPTMKKDEAADTKSPPPAEDTERQPRPDLSSGEIMVLEDDGYCD